MNGLTLEDLRARYAVLVAAREARQREARTEDLGFAYALGELEHLIGLLTGRQAAPAPIEAAPALIEKDAA